MKGYIALKRGENELDSNRLRLRQREEKGAPCIQLALGADASSLRLNDVPGNGEPQSRTARLS